MPPESAGRLDRCTSVTGGAVRTRYLSLSSASLLPHHRDPPKPPPPAATVRQSVPSSSLALVTSFGIAATPLSSRCGDTLLRRERTRHRHTNCVLSRPRVRQPFTHCTAPHPAPQQLPRVQKEVALRGPDPHVPTTLSLPPRSHEDVARRAHSQREAGCAGAGADAAETAVVSSRTGAPPPQRRYRIARGGDTACPESQKHGERRAKLAAGDEGRSATR